MIARFSSWLIRLATVRNLILFFGLFILTTSVIFPLMTSLIEAPAGELETIDTKLCYSPEELQAIMAAYGEQGRRIYALSHLTADVLFPLVYAFFFGLLISYLFQRSFSPDSWVQRLNLTPFALLILDLMENTGLVILLLSYPTSLVGLAQITGIITSIKWVAAGLTVTLPFIGVIGWLYHRLARPAKGQSG
jgi:hypothetical protein